MMNSITGKKYFLIISWIITLSYFISAQVSYELYMPKHMVFMGEKIRFELRFSYPENMLVHIRSIQDLEIDILKDIEIADPVMTTEVRQGTSYRIYTWHGTCYAQKSGMYHIPALKAVYFYNYGVYEVLSRSISIKVQELPALAHRAPPVYAIGEYTQIRLSSERAHMKVGEAQKLQVQIIGTGNIEKLSVLELKVPAHIKYYASAHTNTPTGKQFEFVIQPIIEGEYVIPAQLFTYFDTNKKMYKKIVSNSLQIHVDKADKAVLNALPLTRNQILDHDILDTSEDKKPGLSRDAQIKQLLLYGWPALQWPLYILFCLLPLIIGSFVYLQKLYTIYMASSDRQRRRAFKRARKQLQQAQIAHHDNKIYEIIQQTCHDRLYPAKKIITDRDVTDILLQTGCSEQEYKQWQDFIQSLLAHAYRSDTQKNNIVYFEQAYKWLNQLEKLL
jgi:hypothetical protein